jgi:hypothetical protein
MNDAQLHAFRLIADAMQTAPTDWEWIGSHMSQRMFGITEKRAREFAERHGGTARKMPKAISETVCRCPDCVARRLAVRS